jgi:hypothetical protein
MSSATTDVSTTEVPSAKQATKAAKRPFIQTLARAGYVAKGVVYLTVGYLAAEAALGQGGQLGGGKQGLAKLLSDSPFGGVIVGLLGAGLLAFAAWNVIRAIWNNDHEKANWKGYLKRVGFGITAVIYAGLGAWAMGAAIAGGADASDQTNERVGEALQWPGGAIAAGGVGLFIIGYGFSQIIQSWRNRAGKGLDLSRLGSFGRKWVMRTCQFGVGARGVVAMIFGFFILNAAWTLNKDKAGSPGEVLESFLQWNYGWAVLAVVSVGLMAYGVYMLCKSAFKPIDA